MEISFRPKMVWTPNLYRVPTVSLITFLLSGSHIFKGFPPLAALGLSLQVASAVEPLLL